MVASIVDSDTTVTVGAKSDRGVHRRRSRLVDRDVPSYRKIDVTIL